MNIKHLFKNYRQIIFILFFVVLFLITIIVFNKIFAEKELKISFLDVGQGDSILIQTPDRQKILIDAGPNDRVVGKLEKHLSVFNRSLDLVLMSHGDSDHITGFLYLFPKYNIKNILLNGDQNKESSIYLISQEEIKQEIEIDEAKTYIANCGDILSFGEGEEMIKMYILNPIKMGSL